MDDNRTQIKFDIPDIDGTPKPQLITLEKETPIEGTSEKEDGTKYVWHKWLCTSNQYFMASPALDGMLKLMPNRVGKVMKVEKVLNPKGGHPYFQINGFNRDQIIEQHNVKAKVDELSNAEPAVPLPQPASSHFPVQPTKADETIARLEQKIDKVIEMLNNMDINSGMPA